MFVRLSLETIVLTKTKIRKNIFLKSPLQKLRFLKFEVY
jgi:hypothetical protein